jgi:hypothetical protein
MIFLQPDQKLVKFLRKYARGRTIIDCGAGECALEEAMKEKEVISLDLYPYEDTPALRWDCREFPFKHTHLPVFIRPCHDDFVHDTITKHIRRVDSILYIGLEKNLEIDLHGSYDVVAIENGWTGPEGEKIYQVTETGVHTDDKLYTFMLVHGQYSKLPCWYELKASLSPDRKPKIRLENWSGGFCLLHEEDKVLKTQQANDFNCLDWKGTILDDPTQKGGWLSRHGRFYGCASQLHIRCALFHIKQEPTDLEKKGWVHIYSGGDAGRDWICQKRLSASQRNWLSLNGYKVEEWD